jgi:hypothetical protein
MAHCLAACFFKQAPPPVPDFFPDNPPPIPTCPFLPISTGEIQAALLPTSNKSVLGLSGHGWHLIKWAWKADGKHLHDLLDACLQSGHHPKPWKVAAIAVVPKLNHTDPTLPKNY